MAGICDICGGKTGFRNIFRCQDGVICKKCYQVVSNDFSHTIAKLTLVELKETYIENAKSFVSKQDVIRKLKQKKAN